MTSLTPKCQFNNNTHLDKKQTILSQYGQINTIKKNKKRQEKAKREERYRFTDRNRFTDKR